MRRHLTLFLAALLTLSLLLAGCGGGNNSGNAANPADGGASGSQTAGEPSGPIAEGDAYRDFTATLADGSTFTLSDHEGKVILLNFWATWCGPCVGEMPAFTRLVEAYGDDLVLLAVNCGEPEKDVTSFLEKNGYTFPVALDPEYAVSDLYPSDGIPYTVIIDQKGTVSHIQVGAGDADTMYEMYSGIIDELLK